MLDRAKSMYMYRIHMHIYNSHPYTILAQTLARETHWIVTLTVGMGAFRLCEVHGFVYGLTRFCHFDRKARVNVQRPTSLVQFVEAES